MSGPWCVLGRHPIEVSQPYYVRVTGWEKPGRGAHGRSGSSLVLRERLPEAACVTCVTRAVHGVPPTQEAML